MQKADRVNPDLPIDPADGRADFGWFWPNAHWILIAFFFLALLPLVSSEARYHGDEIFYTDGAIGMIQTNDYVTPHYSNGVERFRKPVLTYWVLAASYKLLGISLFASRIPFLLAGCLVVWFTYQISLCLLRREEDALAATVVLSSNIQLLTLATRSTPDILQCSFIMASLYGFANILFKRSLTTRNYSCAYLGSALAISTKGLLGIFPVLFSFLLSLVYRPKLARPKELVNWKIMAVAAGFALLWFALIFFKHGTSAITGFLGDQMTERLSGNKFYVLENVFAFLLALLRHFAPWSILLLLLVPKEKDRIREFFAEHKTACVFTIGWYVLLFVIFMWSNIKRTRYLFPAYPMLAIVFSAMLVRVMHSGPRAELMRKSAKVLLLAGLAGAVALALSGLFMDAGITAGGSLLFLLTLLLYLTLHRTNQLGALAAVGAFLVLLFSVYLTFVRPVFCVSPARAIAHCLAPLTGQEPVEVGSIDLPRDYVHQTTLFSGGKIWVRPLPVDAANDELRRYPALILAESGRDRVRGDDYQVVECGYSYREWEPKDIFNYLTAADKERFLSGRKQHYYLAIPK